MTVRLAGCHIITYECMEGIAVAEVYGINGFQDAGLLYKAVIKEDVSKLKNQQGTLFPALFDVTAPVPLRRFLEISRGGAINPRIQAESEHSTFPVAVNATFFVKNAAKINGLTFYYFFAIPDGRGYGCIFIALFGGISDIHDVPPYCRKN